MSGCWECGKPVPDGPGEQAGESCGWCGVWLAMLDPDAVPPVLRPLLALARRWGMPDDVIRAQAVDAAPDAELRRLVGATQSVEDDLLEWLNDDAPGTEARPHSREWLALSAVLQAADLAVPTLRRRPRSSDAR